MNSLVVVVTVVGLVAFVIASEVVIAVLPLTIVVAFVPPDERRGLADLLAATDSSRRLRLWPALRAAATARRRRAGGGKNGSLR